MKLIVDSVTSTPFIAPSGKALSGRPGSSIPSWHWDRDRERTPETRKAMYFNWILTGHIHPKEVRLFGIGGEIASQFSIVRQMLHKEKLAVTRRRALADFLTQALGTLAIFVTLGAIAYRTVLGAITLGDMVMFFHAFQRGLAYLRNSLENLADLYEKSLFLSYLCEFLDVKPQVRNPAAPQPVPKQLGRGVEVDRAWFRYPNTEQMVLKDISFTIKPGEVVALVGENGSGKTTLVKLLCRLYGPTRGQVTLERTPLHQTGIHPFI